MKEEPEFYIGWQTKAPASIGKTIRLFVVGLLFAVLILGCLLGLSQRTIGVSVFEWGKTGDFSGTLVANPYPHLVVTNTVGSISRVHKTYYLVKPLKFGLDADVARKFDGKEVTLRGTLIYRDAQAMIEVLPESIEMAKSSGLADGDLMALVDNSQKPVALGRRTVVGEIVDSKCFLGVMNPGRYVPHKACAIRCISGGCPPLFIPQTREGTGTNYYLLVSAEGLAVNKEVLDKVAEPLEITGEVVRQGDLLILKADPATFRRVK